MQLEQPRPPRWQRWLLIGTISFGALLVLAFAALLAAVLVRGYWRPYKTPPTQEKASAFEAAAEGAAGHFGGGQNVYVGTQPASLAVADLDGDHAPDLLTANLQDTTISLRYNDGHGDFRSKTGEIGVGQSPVEVVTGDLDADGRPDVLVLRQANSQILVLRNDGHDGFIANPSVRVGGNPGGLTLADVDGDGDLDLLVADYARHGTVSVLLNDGHAHFTLHQQVPVDAYPIRLALADLDHDGDPDLLTANYGSTKNSVSIRLNNGQGRFEGTRSVWAGYHPQALVVADLNGDHKPDLMTSDESFALKIRLGNGHGGFTAQRLALAVHTQCKTLALGDVDEDGDLDLLVPGTTRNDSCQELASIWRNDGHAGFQPGQEVPLESCQSPSAALADIDGDGRPDLLVLNETAGSVSVSLNAHRPATRSPRPRKQQP